MTDSEYAKRRPQDEIPHEVWVEQLLKAYRKEHQELDQLRSYAKGLEEENVMMEKRFEELKRQIADYPELLKKIKSQEDEIKRLVRNIEVHYPLRVFKLSTYKNAMLKQRRYYRYLQRLLTANSIKYDEIAAHPFGDEESIDVNAILSPKEVSSL